MPGVFHLPAPFDYRNPWNIADGAEIAARIAAQFKDDIALQGADTVAACIMQPILGAGGVIAPHDSLLPLMRQFCDRHGILLIADEVITAFGRTSARTGSHVAHVPAPDSYRPLGGVAGPAHATALAEAVEQACQRLIVAGHGVSGIILDPFFVNEGFPDLAPGFLDAALTVVRRHGGLVIADEVQPGFDRLGSHFWGHLRAGFQPDIVTMGKPMGNGHPVAAVATSFQIMSAFRTAFRYFNTFGGNPVSCAAASAVLDVLAAENLQARAAVTGDHQRGGLRLLAEQHDLIGDVRGAGLAVGAELVTARTRRAGWPTAWSTRCAKTAR